MITIALNDDGRLAQSDDELAEIFGNETIFHGAKSFSTKTHDSSWRDGEKEFSFESAHIPTGMGRGTLEKLLGITMTWRGETWKYIDFDPTKYVVPDSTGRAGKREYYGVRMWFCRLCEDEG